MDRIPALKRARAYVADSLELLEEFGVECQERPFKLDMSSKAFLVE